MLTNMDVMRIAMLQSARDINCEPDDFLKSENVIVASGIGPLARAYYKEPIACNLVSYGNNLVASVRDEYRDIIEEYIGRTDFFHSFETPSIHWLDRRLAPYGQCTCFMAEYFLPDMRKFRDQGGSLLLPNTLYGTDAGDLLPGSGIEFTYLGPENFAYLYNPLWSNALCEDRKKLDILGIGAFDDGRMVGLAACSKDCDTMWQIGIDVVKDHRRQGIASALTRKLGETILQCGRIPFYCCAWSNIRSAGNAISAGFRPAWVELTVKPEKEIKKYLGHLS